MHDQYIRSVERLLISEEVLIPVKGRSENVKLKWNTASTRTGITNKTSNNKNITKQKQITNAAYVSHFMKQ